MPSRIFAALRTAVIGPVFVALWTYFLPRWVVGAAAFEDPRPLGWVVVAAGAAIIIPCFSVFAWVGRGTPFPLDPPKRLVIRGPYRFVRNPMYEGMALILLGEAMVFPHLVRLMLITAACGAVLVALLVMGYEEPALRQSFGADYEKYCRHVRRWIPRLRPFDNPANAALQ